MGFEVLDMKREFVLRDMNTKLGNVEIRHVVRSKVNNDGVNENGHYLGYSC